MHGLICTHHLNAWGGSECVTIELIEELLLQDCDITIYCPYNDPQLLRTALGADVAILCHSSEIELDRFDFVYSHHQMPSRFLQHLPIEKLFGPNQPVFIYNHLSPSEPFEFPGPFCEAAFADIILCNSPETAKKLCEFGPEYSNSELFTNPAPKVFDAPPYRLTPEGITSVLAVSNHAPQELTDALEILRDKSITVTQIGDPEANRRLLPNDLFDHDAVVTIGKTIPYALRAHRPVFCYDWFGGPGWLTGNTFEVAASVNFSGRCVPRKRTAEDLVEEILSGFSSAHEFSQSISSERLEPFRLENRVSELVQRIRSIRRGQRKVMEPAEKKLLKQKLSLESETYALVDREYVAKLDAQKYMPARFGAKRFDTPPNIETKILRTPRTWKSTGCRYLCLPL